MSPSSSSMSASYSLASSCCRCRGAGWRGLGGAGGLRGGWTGCSAASWMRGKSSTCAASATLSTLLATRFLVNLNSVDWSFPPADVPWLPPCSRCPLRLPHPLVCQVPPSLRSNQTIPFSTFRSFSCPVCRAVIWGRECVAFWCSGVIWYSSPVHTYVFSQQMFDLHNKRERNWNSCADCRLPSARLYVCKSIHRSTNRVRKLEVARVVLSWMSLVSLSEMAQVSRMTPFGVFSEGGRWMGNTLGM